MEHNKLFDTIESALECITRPFIYHYSKTPWGASVDIIHIKGTCHARLYIYEDDDSAIYLDSLSVSDAAREGGLGRRLQEVRELAGMNMGAREALLWVEKGSWMHDWYERRGYVDWQDKTGTDKQGGVANEGNDIWMRKIL